MTAEEFERQYAERSGLTVMQLRKFGRIVAPCHCGDPMCEGWQSTTPERLKDEQDLEGMGYPDDAGRKEAERMAAMMVEGLRK